MRKNGVFFCVDQNPKARWEESIIHTKKM